MLKKCLTTVILISLMSGAFAQNSHAASAKKLISQHSSVESNHTLQNGKDYSQNNLHSQQDSQSYPHHIFVGANYTRAYLKPSGNPSFSGNLWGAQASYAYCKSNFFYGALDFEWRYGNVKASNGKRDVQDIIGEERLGYLLEVSPNILLTFFSGFGFRQIWHDVKLKESRSIDLRYNHFYMPLGIYSHFYPTDFISFGLNATWYAQVFPTLTISPLGGARWKLQRKFANFLIELPVTFLDLFVKNLSLILTPQLEVWQDGRTTARSSSGVSLGLPKNTYIFWGGEVNLKYRF